jgi:lipopolysaccharide export LptBFGC system permease protein LptF|tara:strand:- start:475 stop:666 length:192 start_codon:yes stop_codon:yes gene_type:complete
MNLPLPLIIACIIIVLALIVFPLIISYKAEKQDSSKEEKQKSLSEWEKIKEYGNKINKKTRKK